MIYKKSLLKITFSALLISAVFGCKNEDKQLEERRADLDSLSTELTEQQQIIDSLQSLMNNSEIAVGYPIFFGRKFDTIPNPEEYITDALKKQKGKIPLDGVLGGNMEYRLVEVLTEDWVLAIYDDGHIQGKSIFKYELQKNGDIRFSEVVSKLPNDR